MLIIYEYQEILLHRIMIRKLGVILKKIFFKVQLLLFLLFYRVNVYILSISASFISIYLYISPEVVWKWYPGRSL